MRRLLSALRPLWSLIEYVENIECFEGINENLKTNS